MTKIKIESLGEEVDIQFVRDKQIENELAIHNCIAHLAILKADRELVEFTITAAYSYLSELQRFKREVDDLLQQAEGKDND